MGRIIMKNDNSIKLVQQISDLEVTTDENQINKNCVTQAILTGDFKFNSDLIAYTMLAAVKKMKQGSESIDLSPDKSFRKVLGIKRL